ncbi:MAG: pantoate--beta-alanine ligase [Flavobacteriaceae bacterium]
MKLIKTTAELNLVLAQERKSKKKIGLVPTMGALHEGHLNLVKRALFKSDVVIVSIFVNPTQFNDQNDLNAYPRTLEKDLDRLSEVSSTLIVFHPDAQELYGDQLKAKSFDFKQLDSVMEGAHRPGHFNGVATVVELLFKSTRPTIAFFGEKDYQQTLIIKQLVKQKRLGILIEVYPTIRESNGLARSSRNERLSAQGRLRAAFIYEQLMWVKRRFSTASFEQMRSAVTESFAEATDFELEYFEIAQVPELILPLERKKNKKYRAFIAARIEGVRLIDSIALNE